MSIAEKLSQLYQECKMNSLLTLLSQKQKELTYQQELVDNALDPDPDDLFSLFPPKNENLDTVLARKNRILHDIAIIKSYLPNTKTYGFKKSVKKTTKSPTKVKKSVKKTKKSPKKSAKKSPKKAKKSPKKTKKC